MSFWGGVAEGISKGGDALAKGLDKRFAAQAEQKKSQRLAEILKSVDSQIDAAAQGSTIDSALAGGSKLDAAAQKPKINRADLYNQLLPVYGDKTIDAVDKIMKPIDDKIKSAGETKIKQSEDAKKITFDFIKRLDADPTVKTQNEIAIQVSKMDALLNSSRAGDMNGKNALDQTLITVFNKINDPGSVVRESEYARTSDGLSFVNRFQGAFDKFVKSGGAGLTDQEREDLVTAAKIIANSTGEQYNRILDNQYSITEELGGNLSTVQKAYPKYSGIEPLSHVGGTSKKTTVEQKSNVDALFELAQRKLSV